MENLSCVFIFCDLNFIDYFLILVGVHENVARKKLILVVFMESKKIEIAGCPG